ncbi:MAG: hypothetical protein KDD82_01065 [Planctomycetes bacterium]|nr:hypothetical protein [Planctomycetota bacterium]
MSSIAHNVDPRGPFDFTLPRESEEPFTFDAAWRAAHTPLIFFYRGYW